jgi:ketosteroid isomerase-like protein
VTSRRIALAMWFVVAFVTIPSRAQAPTDANSVTTFYTEWFTAGPKSPEAYASFYATDGMVLPPGRPPAIGRDAIAAWQRESQASAPYKTKPEGVVVDETRFLTFDIVVQRSTLRGQRIARESGAQTPFETKYLDVLRRSVDGRLEVVYRMWSDNNR